MFALAAQDNRKLKESVRVRRISAAEYVEAHIGIFLDYLVVENIHIHIYIIAYACGFVNT
jgi:hypothetical protein